MTLPSSFCAKLLAKARGGDEYAAFYALPLQGTNKFPDFFFANTVFFGITLRLDIDVLNAKRILFNHAVNAAIACFANVCCKVFFTAVTHCQ